MGLTAANNSRAFADAVEILLDEIAEDATLSDRCRTQAEQFPWSETIMRLGRLSGATPVTHRPTNKSAA